MIFRGFTHLCFTKRSPNFYRCFTRTLNSYSLRDNSGSKFLISRIQGTNSSRVNSLLSGLQQTQKTQKANIFTRRRKRNFHSEDNIPKEYELIYVAPMENYIFWTQVMLIACSSAIVITLFANILDPEGTDLDPRNPIEVDFTLSNNFQLLCALGCFLCFIGASRIVIRRVILRMYYNEEKNEFVATFLSLNPKKVNRIRFNGGEVSQVTRPDPFNINALRGQFSVHGRRITVLEKYFRYPKYYNLMMGHEKPEGSKYS